MLILDPPQVFNKNQNISFEKEDSTVTLDCEVECSNPAVVKYTWYSSNGTVLFEKLNDSKFVYTIDKSPEQNIVEVYCITSNGLMGSSDESRMDFFLSEKGDVEARTGNLF